MVGSSLNGFGSKHSDMDVCLLVNNHQKSAVDILSDVCKRLDKMKDLVLCQNLITARVPILRVQFRPPNADIQMDLNTNNPVGIRNTHLLYYYAERTFF